MKHIKNYTNYNEGVFSSLFGKKKEKISDSDIVESYLDLMDDRNIKCSLKKSDQFFIRKIGYPEFTKGFFYDDFSIHVKNILNDMTKDLYSYNNNIYYPFESDGYHLFHIEFNKKDIDYNEVIDLLQDAEDRIGDSVDKINYYLVMNDVITGEIEGPPDPSDRISNNPITIKGKFKTAKELKPAIAKYINEKYRYYFAIYIKIKK